MVIVFDAYGTLFDWETGVAEALAGAGVDPARARALASRVRDAQLRLAWHAALTEAYRDFDRLTRDAAQHALAGEAGADAIDAVVRAQERLPLFPDVKPGLEGLRGQRLAMLSNGTLRALQSVLACHQLLFAFDHVISVDPARTYKPARRAYQHALQVLKADKRDIVFVSANDWDVAAALQFGFRACHLARTAQAPLPYGRSPEWTVQSLADLPALVDALSH